ncbi:MAG: heparinase II/III family protein [Candidatus Kapabacteria bacterium]|jgi:uncharacterized heparinase superfamily protein|nr:heparinase II/III family protein [Candidatus Kapabacteria bacterium]
MRTLFHYFRVVYYQILKPRFWRTFVLKRTRDAAQRTFPTIKPLFFNAEEQSSIGPFLEQSLSRELILTQADAAIHHRFALFSDALRDHGEAINWHKDYASGKEWDKHKPAEMLDFMTSEHGSDVKYTWDLNRCYWFTWLGMAHLLDAGDTRSANAFAQDVRSWIAENPLGMGINWAMPMEVAIRATNWILAHSFFHTSSACSDEFWQGFMRVLWQHGKFLSYNLEYVRHNANHFSSNAMGLVVLGAFFYHTRTGKRWFQTGKRFLEKEILRQFTKDGVNYEKSTSYHRFVVEMMSIAAVAAERVGSPFSAQFFERLHAATSCIAAYTRPDGSAPMIGDNDNGRVIKPLALEDWNNHLSILALSANLLRKAELFTQFHTTSPIALTETALCGVNIQQITSINSSINSNPHSSTQAGETYFIHGGYIIHKTSTSHIFTDVGDYGMNGWGGHGHNDCLSFEFWLQGQTIITDSGTGCYTSNTALRNRLRSTKAHNTVMIGGKEQTEWLSGSLWRIQKDELAPNVLEVRSGKQGAAHTFALSAEHSGYRQRFGVIHRRYMKFHSTLEHGKLGIVDELIPVEQAMIGISGRAYFHIPPEITVTQQDDKTLLLKAPAQTLTLKAKSPIELEHCLISRFYGDVRQAWQCSVECSLERAAEVVLEW